MMKKQTIIPFGPQHPVLPEPVHLDLVVEDEMVVEAIPRIGYVHRGLEKLVETKDYVEMVYVAERICGICSYIHGMTYCQAVEKLMGVQIPERAVYLRTLWSELARVHNHLMWLGFVADAFGFESLFMNCWRIREKTLDIIEETTGGRVIFGAAKIGGVRRDIPIETLSRIVAQMDNEAKEIRAITNVFLNDSSVKHRLVDVGILSKADAYASGAVGPVARASGISQDMRQLPYAAFSAVKFEPVVETAGDCYARCVVRIRELFESMQIIKQIALSVPEGPIEIKVTGNPTGEVIERTEQPRGEVIYYLKANGTRHLDRLRIRTPTFANIPALLKMIPGSQLADIPILVLTIDPCISCTER